MKGNVKGYCRDCKYFINNFETEENDITDYEDVVCTYHMADGFTSNDYCSMFVKKEQNNKSILVIDTPNDCDGCPCLNYGMWYCQADKKHRDGGDDDRPEWCPLKPMPQELPTPYMMRQIQIANGIQTEKPPYTEEYQKGYNDCIGELLGETE